VATRSLDESYIDQVLNGSRRSMQHIVHMLDADILATRRDMRQQMRQHCGAFLDGAVAVSSGRTRARAPAWTIFILYFVL
jgi:hypothetical protein